MSRPPARRPPLIPIAAGVVAALVIGVVVTLLVRHPDDGGTTARPQPTVVVATTTPEPVPTTPEPTFTTDEPTPDPSDDALAKLQGYRDGDRSSLPPSGSWVAQLASKYPGAVDDLQTTDTGSHTFEAPDILAEHEGLRNDPRLGHVFLMLSTDYGKHQLVAGQPLWVTFDDEGFGSAKAVTRWCRATFTEYSAEELKNACAPRPLNYP